MQPIRNFQFFQLGRWNLWGHWERLNQILNNVPLLISAPLENQAVHLKVTNFSIQSKIYVNTHISQKIFEFYKVLFFPTIAGSTQNPLKDLISRQFLYKVFPNDPWRMQLRKTIEKISILEFFPEPISWKWLWCI